jgi:hypothetical protein
MGLPLFSMVVAEISHGFRKTRAARAENEGSLRENESSLFGNEASLSGFEPSFLGVVAISDDRRPPFYDPEVHGARGGPSACPTVGGGGGGDGFVTH